MKSPTLSRRNFLVGSAGVAAVTIVTVLTARRSRRAPVSPGGSASAAGPYGPLRPVADLETSLPLLMLPEGFEYRSYSWSGDPMSNGEPTPDGHDGMGVIHAESRDGATELVLVRNHEREFASPIDAIARYDTGARKGRNKVPGGGTTNLVFRGRRFISVEPSLGGTLVNCAGGVTPWGTWLSCEETLGDYTKTGGRRHGYVFEVGRDAMQTTARPLVSMGRFAHEAVAIDPETRLAYMTEDYPNRSAFYRFIPNDPSGMPGSYEAGGRLQAARVVGKDHADLHTPAVGDEYSLEWVELSEPDADPGVLPEGFTDASGVASGPFLEAWSKGALRMSRGEGICFHAGKFYVVDTTAGIGPGGKRGYGEGAVWEYDPVRELIRAVFVAGTQMVGDNIDNITVSPRGGIVLCEDGEPIVDKYGPGTRLLGLSTLGESYTFAKNNLVMRPDQVLTAGKAIAPGDYRGSEWAGVCFDPAGEVLFANLQEPGITFAIWGPWAKGNL
ncbi:MAG: PhoX family protein [Burkholderiales bacterium]